MSALWHRSASCLATLHPCESRAPTAVKDIDGFRFEHLTVEGYDPHASIKMDMAV